MSHKPKLLAGLLLAAGGSSRLGTPKQLIDWRSKPLIAHAVEQSLAVCDAGVVVVTGAHADAVAASLQDYRVELVHNPDWQSGVGKSLADGVCVLRARGAAGVLVMLCDQPLVLTSDLLLLANAWQDAPHLPAASRYLGAIGVPAIFPSGYFDQLAKLRGDAGARALLRGQNECTIVDMPNAAVDIDTREDIESLRRYDQHSNENCSARMKRISIEYFAILRERAGCDNEVLETSTSTPADLYAELQSRYDFPVMASVKVAINDEFADWKHQLQDGDTVVFIPPVAGG